MSGYYPITYIAIGYTLDFHFRDLAMTPSESSNVKFFCRFGKSDIEFPMVFHSRTSRVCSQVEALSACEEIMTTSIAIWPQFTIVADRRQTTL